MWKEPTKKVVLYDSDIEDKINKQRVKKAVKYAIKAGTPTKNIILTNPISPIPGIINAPLIIDRDKLKDKGYTRLYMSPTTSFPLYSPSTIVFGDCFSENIRKQVTNYYIDKIIDWLKENDKYKKLLDKIPAKDHPDKVEYVKKYLMDKGDVEYYLSRYVRVEGINWCILSRKSIKPQIKHYLYKKLEKTIDAMVK